MPRRVRLTHWHSLYGLCSKAIWAIYKQATNLCGSIWFTHTPQENQKEAILAKSAWQAVRNYWPIRHKDTCFYPPQIRFGQPPRPAQGQILHSHLLPDLIQHSCIFRMIHFSLRVLVGEKFAQSELARSCIPKFVLPCLRKSSEGGQICLS